MHNVAGNVRAMPDKLIGFKSDLVQGNEGWQEWSFRQLLRAIKHWMDMNPVTQANESETQPREPAYIPKGKNIKNEELSGEISYQTREDIGRQIHGCVYCDKTGYFSAKKMPKNYLSWRPQNNPQPPASCRSHGCHNFQRKHNTSICDQTNNVSVRRFLTAQDKGTGRVIYPVVLVEVNGIKCPPLLDTGAGSSYASSNTS